MARRMTIEEREAFLAEPRVGIISVSSDGDRPPLAVPTWYGYEPGGAVTFFTGTAGRTARRSRLIERAGAITLAVQQDSYPYRYVTIEGTVVSEDHPPSREQMLAIARRYLPEEMARGFAEMEMANPGPGLVLYTVRPDRWLTSDFNDDDTRSTSKVPDRIDERLTMLLENKVAVIYGAGGPIGGAVARAFASEGAAVYLSGRTARKLDAVASDIRTGGGTAETATLDALDERAVDEFVDDVVGRAGKLDISMNVIGYGDIQQPLLEISLDNFLQPIVNAMTSQFLTTRAAARHMVEQRAGVILHFGGNGPQTLPGLGGFKIALDAIEGLRRQWACELGEHGVRVVTLKTSGIPESIDDGFPHREAITASIRDATLLKRPATLADVGHVAAFVASDRARSMTSTEVNISCGAMVD